tara:strand:+ start:10673 stop:11548 length:876 start_codon:yes stop_codon:yes gene_type:complete
MPDDLKNLDNLKDWIGKTETIEDFISPTTIAGMSATLDRDDSDPEFGDAIPASWHWLFFNKAARRSKLGIDGHPARGDFLPPVPLPRRMWAGSKVELLKPLEVGSKITRLSTISNVTIKEGRAGTLVFVDIDHQVSGNDGTAVTDLQTVVYRGEAPKEPTAPTEKPKAKPLPDGALWSETVTPDTVLLFRYSALTFIGHRIHYDRDYTINEEGYPALLVHGPLTATLLLDLARRNLANREITGFDVRASGPLFDNASFTIHGKLDDSGEKAELWAVNNEGELSMSVTAAFD